MVRPSLVLAVLSGAVSGCVAVVATSGAGPAPAQEAACAAAVAQHVGKEVGEVAVEGSATAIDGSSVVTLRDGDRVHTCEVGADGRVLAIRHPAGE